jgi:hypothetical protein
MDHVVYTDTKSKELEKILDGTKSMIIRGATGRKLPYGRVCEKDILYFMRNNGEGRVLARAVVSDVFNSEKMEKSESIEIVEANQEKLQLDQKQFEKWAGKRYIVLITIKSLELIDGFVIDRSEYNNMDDWLPVEDINSVRK